MEFDVEVIDYDELKDIKTTLEINYYSLKNYGQDMTIQENTLKLYEALIKYVTNIWNKPKKYEVFHNRISQVVNDLIGLDTSKYGVFEYACIQTIARVDKLVCNAN